MVDNLLEGAFREIQQLPYMYGCVKFDAALLEIFTRAAKLEQRRTPKGKIPYRIMKFTEWNTDKRWIVISQPFGKQRYPDFVLILGGGGIVYVEAKSGMSGSATWNSGYPHRGKFNDRIYILNGQKRNKGSNTTFMLGGDLITQGNEEKLDTLRAFLTAVNNELRLEYAGLDFYPEHLNPKIQQRPKTSKWLNNPLREQRESNVFASFVQYNQEHDGH